MPAHPEKPLQYLSVTGTGKPASVSFAALTEALYAEAYHIRFCYEAREKTPPGTRAINAGPAQNPPGAWQYSLLVRLPGRVTDTQVVHALRCMAETRRAGTVTSACLYRNGNIPPGQTVRVALFGREPDPQAQAAVFSEEKNGAGNGNRRTGFPKILRAGLKSLLRQPPEPGFS